MDIASPGLSFLEGTYLWEALPRYAGGLDTAANRHYRERVGIDADGASVDDPKDVSTNSHMFGCWETLYAIKQGVEQSGYRDRSPKDVAALVEAMEGFRGFNDGIGHPQGYKEFNGALHQCYGRQFISEVRGGKLEVVHTTSIEDGKYEPEADYTRQPL